MKHRDRTVGILRRFIKLLYPRELICKHVDLDVLDPLVPTFVHGMASAAYYDINDLTGIKITYIECELRASKFDSLSNSQIRKKKIEFDNNLNYAILYSTYICFERKSHQVCYNALTDFFEEYDPVRIQGIKL
jgi:hypothetical protein